MVKKYYTKPMVVNVVQWSGNNLSEINLFLNNENYIIVNNELYIDTFEGRKKVNVMDYVIRNNDERISIMDKETFENGYEIMSEKTRYTYPDKMMKYYI